jgi:hypothetical protein
LATKPLNFLVLTLLSSSPRITSSVLILFTFPYFLRPLLHTVRDRGVKAGRQTQCVGCREPLTRDSLHESARVCDPPQNEVI